MSPGDEWDFKRRLASHVHELRLARGLTQEALAEKCGLSPDTVRRLEQGPASPRVATLRRVAAGLSLSLGTLIDSLEVCERQREREILDLLANRKPGELSFAISVLHHLFGELERLNYVAQRGNFDEQLPLDVESDEPT